jgi:hypothetical protein
VRRARQAAEGLAAQNLAPAALVDVATVTVQRRAGGPARYLGPIFARKDRYPTDEDPSTLLLTGAAAEALPDLPCEPVTGRDGVYRRASASLGREDVTILQHGSGVLVGRGNELAELMESAGVSLVEQAPTLLTVLGDRGQGKTHLCAALGHELVRLGRAIYFTSTAMLVQRLLRAKRDLTLERELSRLDAFEAVVLDDLGYVQQEREEMEVLFTFLAARYELKSVLISSNLVFSQWDRIFKDPMTTVAAIERLVHHSFIVELASTRSFRAEAALERNDNYDDNYERALAQPGAQEGAS